MPSGGPRTFHSSRAFLVRAADLGENDRRLTFFTEADGVVTLVGKAAHRSRKRFGGSLQRYFLLEISWSASPGRMAVLEQSTVLSSFWEIVGDWERVRHADHLLETVAGLFPQPGPKPKAFEALRCGLRDLAQGEPPSSVARKAEGFLLSLGGWGPNLSGCRSCGKGESGRFRFVPSQGVLYCEGCSGSGFPLSLGAVKTWRALQSTPPGAWARLRITEGILLELREVMLGYVEGCLGKPLRSLGGGETFGRL